MGCLYSFFCATFASSFGFGFNSKLNRFLSDYDLAEAYPTTCFIIGFRPSANKVDMFDSMTPALLLAFSTTYLVGSNLLF